MKIKSTIHHILKPKKHKWRIFLESIYNKPGDNQKTKALKQTNTNYKAYARYTSVKLPPPVKLHHLSLQEAFLHIASTRVFLKNNISIRTLSTLLYYSFGIRNKNEKHYPRDPKIRNTRYKIFHKTFMESCINSPVVVRE